MKKWKIVFWIITIISIIQLLFTLTEKNIGISDFIWVVFSGLSLIPIYGFAYQIAVGSKRIAIIIFVLNSIMLSPLIIQAVVYMIWDFSFIQMVFTSIAMLFLFLLLFPQYSYAFKSENLWNK